MRVYTKEHCFLNGFGLHLRHQRMQICEAEHLHEFVEIVYIRSGEGTHGIDGVEYSVRRGSLLFINYEQTHFFRTDTEMELYNILLDPEWISEKLIEPENAFELLTLSAFSEFAQRIGADQPFLNFSGGERSRLERLLDEMLDRYGEAPKSVLALLDVALLRAAAAKAGVSDRASRPGKRRESYSVPKRLESVGKISRTPVGSSTTIVSISSRQPLQMINRL